MISKEIAISWFKGLSGDDRIDLMCLLLDYCLPLELRFIGTYLESAAQKDYYGFRTYESAANNPNDLTYLYPLEDITIRRRLCLYVALLHSTNRQAAAVVFGILSDFQPSGILDDELLTELSLLYTLAANHPAFSFNQKHVLRSKLKCIRLQSVSTTSDLGETVSDCSTGSSLQDADPMDSPRSPRSPSLEQQEPAVKDEKHDEYLPPPIPENPPKVYVKELKVINIQKKGESKQKHESKKKEDYEYIIEVAWSDNTNDKIHKSYEEMFDFQCKLRKMYPTKIDENGQPWKLPFLPGRIRIFNKSEHKGERTPIPDISDYTRLFGSLPVFVRGCDHVLTFFHVNTKSKGRDKKQKTAKKEEKNKNKQDTTKKEKQNCTKLLDNSATKEEVKQQNHSTSILTLSTTEKAKKCEDERPQPVNGTINDVNKEKQTSISIANQIQGKNGLVKVPSIQTSTVPFTRTLGSSGPAAPKLDSIQSTYSVHTHSPNIFPGSTPLHPLLSTSNSITTPQTFDSLVHRSPLSPPMTYSINHHSTNKLGWMYYCTSEGSFSVQDWLKNLRLHKYSETFRGKSFHQLLKLTDKDLENLGMTTGARRKLRVNLEILRKRGCFSSDGQTILDVLPVMTRDFLSCNGFVDSDTERMFSESDSDCGSDTLSDIYSLVQGTAKTQLSCYNCGSLGHVGRQCMAPNMEKRLNFGYRLRLDIGPQVLQ